MGVLLLLAMMATMIFAEMDDGQTVGVFSAACLSVCVTGIARTSLKKGDGR